MAFIPDPPKHTMGRLPYYEESAKYEIPGRGTRKKPEALQGEVAEALIRLGASAVVFMPGRIDDSGVQRYGYRVSFSIGAVQARMDIAALPMRNETEIKKQESLAQALYLTRDWLIALRTAQYFQPGAVPLLPFLIGEGGRTVTEAITGLLALPEWAGRGG